MTKKDFSVTCDEVSFEKWMELLSQKVEDFCGLSYEDLPDVIMIRDIYDGGASVTEAFNEDVMELLREEGYGEDDEEDDYEDSGDE